MPSGNSERSRSKKSSFPVETSSEIFWEIALPMPGMALRSWPSRSICSSSVGSLSMVLATRWYATTVNRCSPLISSSPAVP
jgi:hypothetical protein